MVIYLLNIVLILFWGVLLIYSKNDRPKLSKKIFCTIVTIQWILISGLRGLSVGPDTSNYKRWFENAKELAWSDVWDSFLNVYAHNEISSYSKDPGYIIFEKFFQIFSSEYQVFLIVIAIIFFVAMGRFIYKNSEDPCFSFILFSCLFYSFYAITGLRQTIATALVVFIGFEFIKERNLFKFILVTIIAFFFHKSALVFFPFYFLSSIKVRKRYFVFLMAFVLLMFIGGSSLLLEVASFIGYDKEEVYKADTSLYVLAITVVGCAMMAFYRLYNKKEANMVLNASLIASALSIITFIDQSMMRIQQYYALFLMCSIPIVFNVFDKKTGHLARFFCIGVLILYEISKNAHYVFFWQ